MQKEGGLWLSRINRGENSFVSVCFEHFITSMPANKPHLWGGYYSWQLIILGKLMHDTDLH